jgi:hypothetical protein
LGQACDTLYERVGSVFEKVFLARMGTPDQRVQKGEAFRVARLNDSLGKRDEGAWDGERAGVDRLGVAFGEQVTGFVD